MNQQRNEIVLAPIALFTFRRPEHTRRTLESLAKNLEFSESPLFIYCDGARNETEAGQVEETRKLVRDWSHPNKILIERDRNWGLASSVIAGVTELCERYGRVIVVEDDLIVSPVFLNYMNSALDRYSNEPKIMQISGYMFPIPPTGDNRAVLLPITSTWGWATWNSAWKKLGVSENEITKLLNNPQRKRAFNLDNAYPYTRRLKQQLNGKSDSWGIQWYLSVFILSGLVMYPARSLVQNIGHDGSGTHCKVESNQGNDVIFASNNQVVFPEDVCVSSTSFNKVKEYLREENKIIARLLARFRTKLKHHQIKPTL